MKTQDIQRFLGILFKCTFIFKINRILSRKSSFLILSLMKAFYILTCSDSASAQFNVGTS